MFILSSDNRFRRHLKPLALAAVLSLASFSASARHYARDVIYAPVVDVQPVYRTVRQEVPREVCWDEPVYRDRYRSRYDRRHRSHGNPGGAILGAVIGGAIGNRFGRGNGRDAATFAGAVLGSVIGAQSGAKHRRYGHHEDGRYQRDRYAHTRPVRYRSRCRIERDVVEEERIVAYDVAYEFEGRLRHTRLDHHPGDRIRLHVDLRVAE
jgi:uncharacterized protein YcfJ